HPHVQFPIRFPAVAAAVAAFEGLVKLRHGILLGEIARRRQVLKKMVAFDVDVSLNVVRDLAGGMAEPNALVEGGRANPKRSSLFVYFLRTPEAHVVTLLRVGADGLLKGEIFLAPPKEEIADGRIVVLTLEDRRFGDFQAAPQTEWVGGIPFGGQHDL